MKGSVENSLFHRILRKARRLKSSAGVHLAAALILCATVLFALHTSQDRASSSKPPRSALKIARPSFSLAPSNPSRGVDLRVLSRNTRNVPAEYFCRWRRNGVLVEGVSGSTFPGSSLRAGDLIGVEVLDRSGRLLMEDEVEVANARPAIKKVEYSPNPPTQDRHLIVMLRCHDPDGDPLSYSFSWKVNDEPLAGETGSVLPREHFKRGDVICLKVRVSDGKCCVESEELAVKVSNSPPEIISRHPRVVDEGERLAYQVRALDADRDVLRYSLRGNVPPGMSINPRTGMVSWEARVPRGPVSYRYQIVAEDGQGGQGVQNINLNFK